MTEIMLGYSQSCATYEETDTHPDGGDCFQLKSILFIKKKIIEGWLLYNVVLISAIQQREPAIRTHIPSLLSLPPIPTFPPSHPLGLAETKLGSLCYIIASHQPSILQC